MHRAIFIAICVVALPAARLQAQEAVPDAPQIDADDTLGLDNMLGLDDALGRVPGAPEPDFQVICVTPTGYCSFRSEQPAAPGAVCHCGDAPGAVR